MCSGGPGVAVVAVAVAAVPGRVSTAGGWGRGCKRGLGVGPVYRLRGSVPGRMLGAVLGGRGDCCRWLGAIRRGLVEVVVGGATLLAVFLVRSQMIAYLGGPVDTRIQYMLATEVNLKNIKINHFYYNNI